MTLNNSKRPSVEMVEDEKPPASPLDAFADVDHAGGSDKDIAIAIVGEHRMLSTPLWKLAS